MMDWINSVRNSWPLQKLGLGSRETSNNEEPVVSAYKFSSVLEPWESFMTTAQSVLIWEKPYHSLCVLLSINFLFWMIVWMQPQVYFIVGTAAFILFVHHQWVYHIWPEIRVPLPPGQRPHDPNDEWLQINPSVYSAPEVSAILQRWSERYQKFIVTCLQTRRHKPALFCLCGCGSFSFLLALGRTVSGTCLLYTIVMAVLVGPGCILHLLPPVKSKISSYCTSLKKNYLDKISGFFARESKSSPGDHSPDELSEFLPELGTEEAEAALAVPLQAIDPPEVLQARAAEKLRLKEATRAQRKASSSSTKPTQIDATPTLTPPESLYDNTLAPSPFNSLTPHIPTDSDLPSVSDSSDEDEEFLQGLVFDASKKNKSSVVGGQSDVADGSSSGDGGATTSTSSSHRLNGAEGSSFFASMGQSVANTIMTQYPGISQDLLHSLGQSMLSHMMGQGQVPAGPAVQPPAVPSPRINTLPKSSHAASEGAYHPSSSSPDFDEDDTTQISDYDDEEEEIVHEKGFIEGKQEDDFDEDEEYTDEEAYHHEDDSTPVATTHDDNIRSHDDFEIISDDDMSD